MTWYLDDDWLVQHDPTWDRDIGSDVPAKCDHPDCGTDIERSGLRVCGGPDSEGGLGCGLHFCKKHLSRAYDEIGVVADRYGNAPFFCERCREFYAEHATYGDPDLRDTFVPKPDVIEWCERKLTDPSWRKWRDEHPASVEILRARILDESARRPLYCPRCGNWWHDAPITWWTQRMREDGQPDLGYSPDEDQTPVLCPASDEEGPIPLVTAVTFRRSRTFVIPSHWNQERNRLVHPAEPWWLRRIASTPDWLQDKGMRSLKAEFETLRLGGTDKLNTVFTDGSQGPPPALSSGCCW